MPHGTPRPTILLDCRRALSRTQLITTIGDGLSAQPLPRTTNLDGLYDLFKQIRPACLVLRGVRIPPTELAPIEVVARDAGVRVRYR